MQFNFELDRETDGRWIAEIPEVPGALAYGSSVEEAKAKAYALALYAIADDVERQDKQIPDTISEPREAVRERQIESRITRSPRLTADSSHVFGASLLQTARNDKDFSLCG